METKPTAFHSLDEWVSQSPLSAEAIIYNPSVQDQKAPKAESEVDIDTLEIPQNTGMADTSEMQNLDVISQCLLMEEENMTEELKSSEIHDTSCQEEFPPPSFCDISTEEASDQDFSIEVIAVDWSDIDILDPLHDPDSQNSQEWQDVFNVDTLIDIEETEELKSTAIKSVKSASEDNTAHSIVPSPPFADESDGEQEANLTSLLHLAFTCDISEATAPTPLVVDVAEQQGELFLPLELPHSELSQEAMTQQVLSQVSPPLSTVSIAPSNQTAKSNSVVVAIGESRVGHGIEGESSREISAEDEQFKPDKKEEEQQPIKGVLKLAQDQKSEKGRRVSFQQVTMESDSCDESDSGVSADFSPYSTLDTNSTAIPAPTSAPQHETPIEREIRRAIEREHSLRRSRGLPNLPTSPEYVEIPLRKAVFSCQSFIPTKLERCQGKDRVFAGKMMQQDIHEVVQREQDLVKLGKIPGFYDKGTVRQLREKKQLFEAFQKPVESSYTGAIKSKNTSCSSDISILENDSSCDQSKVIVDTRTECSSTNELTSKPPKGLSEGKGCQIIIIENSLDIPTKRPSNTEVDIDSGHNVTTRKVKVNEDDQDSAPKENPFFKLRSSKSVVKVEQDIREAQERERELRKQRISLYGSTVERGGGKPAGIEEHSCTLSSMNSLPVHDLPDPSQSRVTTTVAAGHSTGKLGMWPPVPAEKSNQMEVPHCPLRQKTPLVQRWESGLINGHND